jgi:hypothetical protein
MFYELLDGAGQEGSKGSDSTDIHEGSMKIRFAVVLKSQVLLEQLRRARVRCVPILAARTFVFALLLCLGSLDGLMVGLTLACSGNSPITIGEW